MMQLKENKFYKTVASVQFYKIFALIVFYIRANGIISSTPPVKAITLVTTLLGAIILVYKLFVTRELLKRKTNILVGLFALSYLVTVYLNRGYGFMENLHDLGWMVILLTVVLEPVGKTEDEVLANYRQLLKIFLFMSVIFALASVPCVFLNIGGKYKEVHKYGFHARRLFGVYRSPNYGALYSEISIVISVYFALKKGSKGWQKTLLIANILLQYLYICYSGSRTGLVCLLVGTAMYGLYYIATVDGFTAKIGVLTVVALCLVCSYYGISAVKMGTTYLVNQRINRQETIETTVQSTAEGEETTGTHQPIEEVPDDEKFSLEREDIKDGVSNGRLGNWKLALKVWKDRKLFGTSLRAYSIMVKDYSKNGRVRRETVTTENDFVGLLVYTGIVGAGLMYLYILITVVALFVKAFKGIKSKNPRLFDYWSAFVIVAVIGVTMVFSDAVFLSNTLQSFIFWLSLGVALSMGSYGKTVGVAGALKENYFFNDFCRRNFAKGKNKKVQEIAEKTGEIDSISDWRELKEVVETIQYFGNTVFTEKRAFSESILYGHLHALCEYGGISKDDEIYMPIIEHGVDFWEETDITPLPRICQGPYLKDKWKRDNKGVPMFVVGPYIHYAKDYYDNGRLQEEKARLGNTVTVFPAHTHEMAKQEYDMEAFVDKTMECFSADFDTVMVCAYWSDFKYNLYDLFEKKGARVVSAGFRSDNNFISRLKTIIQLSDTVVGNDLGTFLGYAGYMGKNTGLIPNDIKYVFGDMEEGQEENEIYKGNVKLFYDNFTLGKTGSPQKQQELFRWFWGVDKVKTKEEIKDIFLLNRAILTNSKGKVRNIPATVEKLAVSKELTEAQKALIKEFI